MNGPLLDFPEYVERTAPIRLRQMQVLAFDDYDDELERTVRDVIEELEYLIESRASMMRSEFREEVRFQAKRLMG